MSHSGLVSLGDGNSLWTRNSQCNKEKNKKMKEKSFANDDYGNELSSVATRLPFLLLKMY